MTTNGRRYTKEEKLKILEEEQEQLLDMYSNVVPGDCRTVAEMLESLKSIEDDYALGEDRQYNVLQKELENFACQIGGLKNGALGERLTRDALNTLVTNHRILDNVAIDCNGEKQEIDFVVLTPKGVFLVETKYEPSVVFVARDTLRPLPVPWMP